MWRSFQTEFLVAPDFRAAGKAFLLMFAGARFLHQQGIASASHGVALIHERCRSVQ
jgi:hypothetical protein